VSGFSTALRVELRKTTTTRMWWVLLLVMTGYVLAIAAFLALAFTAGPQATGGPPRLPPEQMRLALYTVAMPLGYVFPLLVGTLSITTEYRYQTLTYTFLATPRRGLVLLAKLVSATLVGLLFGVVGVLAGLGGAAGVLALRGEDAGLTGEVLRALAQSVLGMGLWAAVGVGVGALLRNQVAAVIVVLAFSQLVEPILRLGLGAWSATREVSRYLPGAAGDAMAGGSLLTVGSPVQLLDWWAGGLVLAGYAVVFFVLGWASTVRRDVA
jgi:ABC-type transport system involved in multi-copper enzyme maturation permease subunit